MVINFHYFHLDQINIEGICQLSGISISIVHCIYKALIHVNLKFHFEQQY